MRLQGKRKIMALKLLLEWQETKEANGGRKMKAAR